MCIYSVLHTHIHIYVCVYMCVYILYVLYKLYKYWLWLCVLASIAGNILKTVPNSYSNHFKYILIYF